MTLRFGVSMHLVAAFSYVCNFLSEQFGIFVMPKPKDLDSGIMFLILVA